MKASVFKNSSHQKIHISKYWKRSDFTEIIFDNHYKKGEKVGFENFKPLLENHFHEDHFKLYV